jgi:hypothetical protein
MNHIFYSIPKVDLRVFAIYIYCQMKGREAGPSVQQASLLTGVLLLPIVKYNRALVVFQYYRYILFLLLMVWQPVAKPCLCASSP